LIEGIDYSVNYQLGTVQILDPSLQASNTPSTFLLKTILFFGQQTRFYGGNVEHKIADNFMVGTYNNERPYTKNQVLDKSVNNTIFGLTPIFLLKYLFY
jgi:cell surface protein SprA